ncbi:phage head closure protein [Cronobacter turicensis]|nr:phage head closure protein [Cronobacter turicensis]
MKRSPSQTATRYSFPDPGELNRRVQFRKRVDSPAADFGTESEELDTFWAWARVQQTGATTYQSSVQTGEAVTHLITIRYRSGMSNEWQMVLPGGEVLRVRRIRDLNSEHRFLLLECESLGDAEHYSGVVYG